MTQRRSLADSYPPGHIWSVLGFQQRILALVAHHWFTAYAEQYGFPNNYTTFDLETNGLARETSLICTAGYSVVRDGVIAETQQIILDWTRHPDIDQLWLQRTLLETERAMHRQGKNFYHNYNYLRQHGVDPQQAIAQLLQRIETAENDGEMLVAHNGWRFDVELLQQHFHNYLGIAYRFEDNMVYDSGVAEKASQLELRDNPLPFPDESLREWGWRVGELRRRGIMWALDAHCEAKYGLLAQAGLGPEHHHMSGPDSQLLHYLVQEHRNLADLVTDQARVEMGHDDYFSDDASGEVHAD